MKVWIASVVKVAGVGSQLNSPIIASRMSEAALPINKVTLEWPLRVFRDV